MTDPSCKGGWERRYLVFPASRMESDQRKKEVRNDDGLSQPGERNGCATGEGPGCIGNVEERESRWHLTGAVVRRELQDKIREIAWHQDAYPPNQGVWNLSR